MITLLGALLGLIGSIVPDIIKFFKGAQDNKHELAVIKLQMESAARAGQQRLEEIGIQADMAESAALYQHAAPIGVKWVDALSASVRPIITYSFFFAYIAVKVAQYNEMTHVQALPWMSDGRQVQEWFRIVLELWNQEDMGLFGAVMAFWFGDRNLTKRRAGK